LIDAHASAHVTELLQALEVRLDAASGSTQKHDAARQAFVVLIAVAARHLPPSDARVASALASILETLRTPSEAVQRGVARALALLVRPLRVRADDSVVAPLVATVLDLTRSPDYGERRGGYDHVLT
jgi:hypothetical protein